MKRPFEFRKHKLEGLIVNHFHCSGPKKSLDTRVESTLQKSMLVPVNYDDPVKQVKFGMAFSYFVHHEQFGEVSAHLLNFSGSFPFPKSEVKVHHLEPRATFKWDRRRWGE